MGLRHPVLSIVLRLWVTDTHVYTHTDVHTYVHTQVCNVAFVEYDSMTVNTVCQYHTLFN